MGKALTREALDAVLGHVDARDLDGPDGCAVYVARLDPAAVSAKADCDTDGHYTCLGCARMSGRKLGEFLAENPHIRLRLNATSPSASPS